MDKISPPRLRERDEWKPAPLQLRLFGEHLASETFFDHLKRLRFDPSTHPKTTDLEETGFRPWISCPVFSLQMIVAYQALSFINPCSSFGAQ